MYESLQQGRVSMGYLYSLDNILYFKSPSWKRNCKGLSKIVSSSGSAPNWFDIQIVFQIMNKHTNFGRHKMGGHDAEGLKNFWEKVIQEQTRQREGEELRLRKSALNK